MKKTEQISVFRICPKSFPKGSKRVLNVFWGDFFEKKNLPSFPWKLETSKSRKKPKKSQYSEFAQKRSQKCPNVFWTCLGQFFWKLLAQLSMEGRVFENFQKKPKIFKVPKKPKIVTKSVQTCFELVLGQIFPKTFFPSVPWKLETSKSRKKPKKNLNIPNLS